MMATSRHKAAGAASKDLLKADFVQPTLLPTTVRCPDKGRARNAVYLQLSNIFQFTPVSLGPNWALMEFLGKLN